MAVEAYMAYGIDIRQLDFSKDPEMKKIQS